MRLRIFWHVLFFLVNVSDAILKHDDDEDGNGLRADRHLNQARAAELDRREQAVAKREAEVDSRSVVLNGTEKEKEIEKVMDSSLANVSDATLTHEALYARVSDNQRNAERDVQVDALDDGLKRKGSDPKPAPTPASANPKAQEEPPKEEPKENCERYCNEIPSEQRCKLDSCKGCDDCTQAASATTYQQYGDAGPTYNQNHMEPARNYQDRLQGPAAYNLEELRNTVRSCTPNGNASICSNDRSRTDYARWAHRSLLECSKLCRFTESCTGGNFDETKNECELITDALECQVVTTGIPSQRSFRCEKDNYHLFWTYKGKHWIRGIAGTEVKFNSGVTLKQLEDVYKTGTTWRVAITLGYIVEAQHEEKGCWQSKHLETQSVCTAKQYKENGYTCGEWWCSYGGTSKDIYGRMGTRKNTCVDYFPDHVFHPKAQKCVEREHLEKAQRSSGQDLKECYDTCEDKNCGKDMILVKNQSSGCCSFWRGTCDFCCKSQHH